MISNRPILSRFYLSWNKRIEQNINKRDMRAVNAVKIKAH
jgi:hypothetical protein